jgi:hypothetical protein
MASHGSRKWRVDEVLGDEPDLQFIPADDIADDDCLLERRKLLRLIDAFADRADAGLETVTAHGGVRKSTARTSPSYVR